MIGVGRIPKYQDTLNYTGGQNPHQIIAANGPTVTPMSALVAEVEAVEAEDMEAGLDYWLPGDVGKRVRLLQL